LGAKSKLGKHGPPLLLLFSRFDEFGPLIGTFLNTQTNTQVIMSPLSEQITEGYDSGLVNAGVKAACAAFGKSGDSC